MLPICTISIWPARQKEQNMGTRPIKPPRPQCTKCDHDRYTMQSSRPARSMPKVHVSPPFLLPKPLSPLNLFFVLVLCGDFVR